MAITVYKQKKLYIRIKKKIQNKIFFKILKWRGIHEIKAWRESQNSGYHELWNHKMPRSTVYAKLLIKIIQEIFLWNRKWDGLVLGRLALKKQTEADYERVWRVVFSCFEGQKYSFKKILKYCSVRTKKLYKMKLINPLKHIRQNCTISKRRQNCTISKRCWPP